MIAASVFTATLILGLAVGLVTGQPFIAALLAVGLVVGYATAFLTVPALLVGRRGSVGASVDDATTGWAEFHRELTRARRFDGRFALIRLDAATIPDVDRTGVRDRVAGVTRRIDRVWVDGDEILMLLPEATSSAVEAALGRVRGAVPEAILAAPGIAVFPQHGITSGSLIAAAYGAGVEDVPTPITTARSEHRGASLGDSVGVAERDVASERAGSGG